MRESNIKKYSNLIIALLIIAVGVPIDLVPYILIENSPFAFFTLMIEADYLYYGIVIANLLPIGAILSAIVGNNKTGYITFLISSVIYLIRSNVIGIFITFTAVSIIAFVYYNTKLTKWIRVLLSVILISADVIGFGLIFDELATYHGIRIAIALWALGLSAITLFIGATIEKIPHFAKFDERVHVLDKNYRTHSINRKLMTCMNGICILLIALISVMTAIIIYQKEIDSRSSESSIWGTVLRNAIAEDSDVFYNRDKDLIEAEKGKIGEALDGGYMKLPAYVVITTNIKNEYYRQYYRISMSTAADKYYDVNYEGEYKLTEQEVNSMYFLPSEGDSFMDVHVLYSVWDEVFLAIEQILSVALLMLVFVNLIADYYIRIHIVHPINQMTTEAVNFAFGRTGNNEDDFNKSSPENRVVIKSGDEIESLNDAIHKTMDDIDAYIDEVNAKSKQVSDMQHNIIITMADIIESRDLNTGGHIKRTAIYVGMIARKLKQDGYFSDILTKEYMDDMTVAAPLHDMGKIHVPDGILNKKGKLLDEEYEIMKTHAAVGKELLDTASEALGEFKYLAIAKQMAESHHEWWNGNGYPNKISGEQIPLCARIMAVADVFDALVSKRCYKEPMDLDVAFDIIRKETGTHFDPVIGNAFLECRPQIEDVLLGIEE